jgi:hypothetical protein
MKLCSENLNGRDHLEDVGVDGRIILDGSKGDRVRRCGLDLSGLGYGPVASCYEHGNVPSGSMKGGKFLE